METKFKFEIGDLVYHRAQMETYRTELKMRNAKPGEALGAPRVMIVITRHYEECPGGVQYHYACRLWDGGRLSAQPYPLNEIELEKWDFEKWLEEFKSYGNKQGE